MEENGAKSHAAHSSMPTDTYSLVRFTGTYRHEVDAKNRITIPADWRAGDEGILYVMLHSSGSHVVVMSPAELDKTTRMIEALPDVPLLTRQKWAEEVANAAQRRCVDKQGRMVLPSEFCEKAGLTGEVTVLGAMGKFRLWNSERFAARKAAEAGDQKLSNWVDL